jgi:hypothetical protein
MEVKDDACISAGRGAQHLGQTVPIGVTGLGEDLAIRVDLQFAGSVIGELRTENGGNRLLRLGHLPEERSRKKKNWQQG